MIRPGVLVLATFLSLACVMGGCAEESLTTPGVEDTGVDDAVASETTTTDSAIDAAPFPVRRLPCVGRGSLASDLPFDTYGALEGEVVSLVPPGTKSCPSDSDHLHVQILVGDKRYDVALTIDSTTSPPLAIHVQPIAPTLPELGWSTADTFDYEKALAVPSADFQALARDALLGRLQTELSKASRVRIFGVSYTDGTGTHNVHRNGKDRDGVILMHRAEADGRDRAIALRFANQVF